MAIGVALFLNIYASSTATTLAIALGYATVVRAVGPDAIERVLSYVQLIMGFAVYGGQFLISGVLSTTVPGTWSLPAAPLILLYPGHLTERAHEDRALVQERPRHVAFLGLLAHLVLQSGLLLNPALPFSRPMQQTRVTGFFLGFTFVTIVLSLFIQFYSARIYNNVATTVAAIAAIVFIGIVVDLITRARVQRQAQLLEFEG
jgi:hypothetical protein